MKQSNDKNLSGNSKDFSNKADKSSQVGKGAVDSKDRMGSKSDQDRKDYSNRTADQTQFKSGSGSSNSKADLRTTGSYREEK